MVKVNGVYAWRVKGIIRYIGSGKDILDSRKSNHLARLRHGKHIKELQLLFNELGEEAFEFIVIEQCLVRELFEREQHYKDIYKDVIYNVNDIVNTKKDIKTGLRAKRHKEKFSEIMSGENNPNCCKLDAEKVREIKRIQRDRIMKDKEIAKLYNCSLTLINNIRKGERWASVNIDEKEKGTVSTAIDIIPLIASEQSANYSEKANF